MTPDRYQRLGKLFEQAVQLDLVRRQELLARECAGDPDLLSDVESLLAHDADATAFPEPLRAEDVASRCGPKLVDQTSSAGAGWAWSTSRRISASAGARPSQVAQFQGKLARGRGLTVSPDESALLYAIEEVNDRDIMLVEGFK